MVPLCGCWFWAPVRRLCRRFWAKTTPCGLRAAWRCWVQRSHPTSPRPAARRIWGRLPWVLYEVRYQLLDNRQQPFENRSISLDVVAEGYDRLAGTFPGATVAPPMRPVAVLVIKLLGPTDSADQEPQLAPVRSLAGRRLDCCCGERARWFALISPVWAISRGATDNRISLALQTAITLSADAPAPARLALRLEDAFGNPLADVPVTVFAAQTAPGAPPSADAGAEVHDTGAADTTLQRRQPACGRCWWRRWSHRWGRTRVPQHIDAPTILLGTPEAGCSEPRLQSVRGLALAMHRVRWSFVWSRGWLGAIGSFSSSLRA